MGRLLRLALVAASICLTFTEARKKEIADHNGSLTKMDLRFDGYRQPSVKAPTWASELGEKQSAWELEEKAANAYKSAVRKYQAQINLEETSLKRQAKDKHHQASMLATAPKDEELKSVSVNRQSCRDDEHTCQDGSCEPLDEVVFCDGYYDCFDGSDEAPTYYCGCQGGPGFECPNSYPGGQCLPSSLLCDGQNDCYDDSDEPPIFDPADCPPCDGFLCDNGACVEARKECNGYDDCPGGEDEHPGDPDACPSCGEEEFRCDSGQCISAEYVCVDDFLGCRDGSHLLDPADCPPCRDDQFRCNSGQCVSAGAVCTGYAACDDGSDEPPLFDPEECPGCPDGKYQCKNFECIDAQYACDGFPCDCDDCTDEHYTGGDPDDCPPCRQDQFRCQNSGRCLYLGDVCNGYNQCGDNLDSPWDPAYDEPPYVAPDDCPPCAEDEFRCNDGQCIDLGDVCNPAGGGCKDGSNIVDNPDDCPPCQDGAYRCNNGFCIAAFRLCNKEDSCGDGSDEYPLVDPDDCPPCEDNEFRCRSGLCLIDYNQCDGQFECPDGDDEGAPEDCPPCREDQFRCRSGKCIPLSYVCDGDNDCGNEVYDIHDDLPYDEPPYVAPEDCPPCGGNEFQCDNGFCIPDYQVCNGVDSCGDNSDEPPKHDCSCDDDQYTCGDGTCIPANWQCDFEADCLDLSDEVGC